MILKDLITDVLDAAAGTEVGSCNSIYRLRYMTKKLNNLIGIPHKHKKLYPRSSKVEF